MFWRSLVGASMFVTLASCGGGTTSNPTVTCPNNTTQTATTTALANAACPAPLLVSIAPADTSSNVSPDSFTTVTATTDSTLDASSLTTANVTLKAGGVNDVTGTVAISGTKAFTFTPANKLNYAGSYTFAATVKDTLGKTLTFSSTFATSSIACISPLVPDVSNTSCVPPTCISPAVWNGNACAVPPPTCTGLAQVNSQNVCVDPPAVTGYTWNDIIKVWVADIGVLVTGANTLPASCVTVGDACWLQSVADGTIKFVNSGAVMTGVNTRPIVFAFYKTSSGIYNSMPMYADVLATSTGSSQGVINGGGGQVISNIKGSNLGVKQTYPAFGCFERIWFPSPANGFGETTTTCPI